MKFVILFALLFGVFAIGFGLDREEFRCQKGIGYVENDCNTCACSNDNLLLCTARNCGNRNNCDVGTTWNKQCNKCWCVQNSGKICTRRRCKH